jgi:hypothetical protein
MKRILIAVALASCLALSVAAQGAAQPSKGSLGLQFTMAGLGTFGVAGVPVDYPAVAGPATTYGIGAKYGIANKLAIGLGLYVGGSSATDGAGTVDNTFAFCVRPAALYSLASKGPITIYTGGYLSAGFYSDTMNTLNRTRSSSILGFGGLLGAEYFVTGGISLGAEYSLGAGFYNLSSTVISTSTTTKTSETNWGVGSASVFLTFYL